MKRTVDIEQLLTWAFVDEMPKAELSSSEWNWKNIGDFGAGGVFPSNKSQRYAFIDPPHPDAVAIVDAVKQLPHLLKEHADRVTIDYEGSWPTLFSDMPLMAPAEAALPAFNIVVMVTSCAVQRRRPRWNVGAMYPHRMLAANGKPVVRGIDPVSKRYADGARCPLSWSPSPREVAEARAEYVLWHRALCEMADSLTDSLSDHTPVRPKAPQLPWMPQPPTTGAIYHNPIVTPQVLAAVKKRRHRRRVAAV